VAILSPVQSLGRFVALAIKAASDPKPVARVVLGQHGIRIYLNTTNRVCLRQPRLYCHSGSDPYHQFRIGTGRTCWRLIHLFMFRDAKLGVSIHFAMDSDLGEFTGSDTVVQRSIFRRRVPTSPRSCKFSGRIGPREQNSFTCCHCWTLQSLVHKCRPMDGRQGSLGCWQGPLGNRARPMGKWKGSMDISITGANFTIIQVCLIAQKCQGSGCFASLVKDAVPP